ncbi:uncharacterized protein LOC101744556 isoform X2 [Bombyx mori]|uniref:Uncharacterized protein n=1 Tax=Bombyx mori TaxID=7091 RepID=A0A8R2DKV0_BOMMO|nr:uncharacterized protein LOC101744556 isoform X2 [Bombyx mori]
MEYKVNLIFLVVFSSKIVVSIPYNEENVRQRAYPAINWPSNLQARENPNFAPPQNFHAAVYQKPYYQEMAQRRINSPNEEFRAPPLAALPKAFETPTGYRVTGTRNDQNYYQNNGQNGLRQFQQINVPPVRQNPVIEQTYFQPIREPLTSVSQNGNPQGQYPRSVLPNYYNQQPLPRLQASQFRSNYMNVPNAEVQRPWVQNMRGAYDNKTQYLSNEPSVNPKEIARSAIELQNKYQSPMEHLPRIVNRNLATNSQMNSGYIPGDNRRPEMRNILAAGTNTNLDKNHKTFMIDDPRGNVELVGNLRPHENKNDVLVNAKDILGKTNEGQSHPTFRPQVINQPQVISSTTGTDIFLHNDVQDTVANTVLNAKSVPYNKPLLQENAVQNPAVLDSISSYRSQPRVKSSNTKFLLRDDLQDTVPNTALNTALNTAYTKSVPDSKPLVQEQGISNFAALDLNPRYRPSGQNVDHPRVTSLSTDTKILQRQNFQDTGSNTTFNIKSVPDNRPLVQETVVLNPAAVDTIPSHKEQPQVISTIQTEFSRGDRLEDTAPNTAFNTKSVPYNKPLVQEEAIPSFSALDSDPSHRNQPRVTSSTADTKNLLRHELQDKGPNTAFNIKSVPYNKPLVQEEAIPSFFALDSDPSHRNQPRVTSSIDDTKNLLRHELQDEAPNTAFNIKSVPDNRPLVQETVVLNPAAVDIIPRHKEQSQIIPTIETEISRGVRLEDTAPNTAFNMKSIPYNKPLVQEEAISSFSALDSDPSHRNQPRVTSSIADTKNLLRHELQDEAPNTAFNIESVPDNRPLVQETVVLNPAAVDIIPRHKEQSQIIPTIETEISQGVRLEDTAPNTAFNTKSVPYNRPLVQEEAIPSFSALDSDPSHRNQPRVTSSIADTKNLLHHELQDEAPNTAFNIKSVPDNRPLVQETVVLNPAAVDIIPRHKEQSQIIPTIETEISRGVRLEDTAPNTAFNMKSVPHNKPLVQEEAISSFSALDSDPSYRNQPRVTSSIADTKNLLRHELQDEAPNTAFNIKSVPDNRPLVQETVVLNPAAVDIIPRHKEQSQIIPTIETEISRGVRLEDTAPNTAFNTKSVPYNRPLVQEEAIPSFSALDSDPSHRNQPRVTSSIADTKNLLHHELQDEAPNTAFNIKSVPDNRPLVQEAVVLNPAAVDTIPSHKEQPQVISTIQTEISRGDRLEDTAPNTAFNTKSVPYNKPLVQEEAIPSFSALDSDPSHRNQPRVTSSIADTKNLLRHELQDEASNTAFNIKSVPDNRPLVQENMGVNSATLDIIPRHREQPQVISTIETEISRGVRLEDTAPNTAFNMKSVPYNKPLVQEDPSAVDNFPQKAPHVSLFSTEAHQLNKEVMPNMRISAQDNEHDKPKSIFDESIIPIAATEKSIETSTLSTNYVTKNNSEHNSNPDDYNPSEFLRQNISFDKYKSQAKTVNLQNETTTTDTPSDTGRPVVKHHHHHSSVGREILDSVLDDNIFNQPSSPMEKSLEKATFDEPLNEPLIPNNDHSTPEPWYLNSEPLRSSNITEEDHFSNNKTKIPEETTFTFSTVPEIKEAKDIENEKPVEVIEKKDFFVNEANWFREQSEDGATNSNVVSPLTSDEDKEREKVQSTTVSSLLSPLNNLINLFNNGLQVLSPLNNKKNDTSKPTVAESYVAPTISSLHNRSTVEDNRQTESTETLTVDARNDDILDLLSSKTDNSEDQLNIILTDSTENILNEMKYIDSMIPLSENNNIANEPINLEDDQMNFDDVAILFNTDSMPTVSTESLDEEVDVFSQEVKAIDNEEIPNPFIGSDETFNIFNENNANGNNRTPSVLTLDTQDEVDLDVRERIVNPTVIQSSIKGDEEDQTITSNTKPDTLPDIFTLNDDAVANPADNNTVMFKVDADFWQKIKNGNITYDVVYLFQAYDQPVVEKETQTIIHPNGTIVQQYVEKTWKKQGVQLFQIPNR